MAHAPSPASADITTILGALERAGYRKTNESKKLAEFEVPSGHTVYVVKTTSRLNQINLRVHPALQRQALVELPGVDSVGEDYRFHSNMTRFPKRLNRGKMEIPHGWQVCIKTPGDLERFLLAFKSFPL